MTAQLEDSGLLRSHAVLFSECFLTFGRNVVFSFSGFKQSKNEEIILLHHHLLLLPSHLPLLLFL
jgi:hypothetical protein